MKSLSRVFRPLQLAAQAFFSHDLAIRRGESGVEIVLEHRTPGEKTVRKPKKALADEAALKERDEVALMLQQLNQVLGELPETRRTLRHLIFVEQALGKKGLKALHKLPLDLLQRALEQFEGLVTNWSPVGLASLRSKMAVAIIDREHTNEGVDGEYPSAAALDSEAVLAEEDARHAAESSQVNDAADDAALAAAYAAIGAAVAAPFIVVTAPAVANDNTLEFHCELGSPSARGGSPRAAAPSHGAFPEIKLRELQS